MDFPSHDEHIRCRLLKPAVESTASGLIDDIMKKYFCQKAGQGSSSCSIFSYPKGSSYSMDKRLLYWSKILEDRKRIACRIQKATGKRLSHVLYNQTEEHRNVQNVKRVIDTAQRLHQTKLLLRKSDRIKENFEIVGTPKVVRAEQWLTTGMDYRNPFLRSGYLQRKLKSATEDGTSPLEFYPDIDKLEVIGQRIHKHQKPLAEVVSDFDLSTISSASKSDSWQSLPFPESCIEINDTVLRGDVRLSEDMTFHLRLKCKPCESETQTVCKIKNAGKRPVYLHVRRVKPKGAAYLPPFRKVFHFNVNSIRLGYGESAEIKVTFHSSERRIQEDIYCLLTEPNFMDEHCKILFHLIGDCYIPQSYFDAMIGDLLSTLISDMIPGPVCDSARRLTDKEMFEKENPGFKCEPQDLREFCEIYRQVKRKCHPNKWNMNLQSLKQLIEGVPDYSQRIAYLDVFTRTVRDMQRRLSNSDSNLNVMLARTAIVSMLDKWERKAFQIQQTVATTDLDLLIIKMPFDMIIEQINLCRSEKGKRRIILHNALFIQMFCALCELAEDIVSYVENSLTLNAF